MTIAERLKREESPFERRSRGGFPAQTRNIGGRIFAYSQDHGLMGGMFGSREPARVKPIRPPMALAG